VLHNHSLTQPTTLDRWVTLNRLTPMNTPPENLTTPNPLQLGHPSPLIDQAILDLLTRINSFSDDHFDTAFVTLDESEVERLVVLLLEHWTDHLDGRLLAGCLLVLREGANDHLG
jgi:hypothetical protein